MSDERSLTVQEPTVTNEQIELIRRTVAKDATDDELQLYFFDCKRRGVHPLDKLIHFTKRAGRYTPITSIDFMRSRAAGSGAYAGNEDAIFMDTSGPFPSLATVTVYRLVGGVRCPFTGTARWAEYYPGDQSGAMWKKMPHTMLGKCAEALALRKGFPEELAGLYAKEEMDQAGMESAETRTIKPPQKKAVQQMGPPLTQPPPDVGRDASMPAAPTTDPNQAVVTIAKVESKPGINKETKAPYVRTVVTDTNGQQYTTFDETIAKFAAECAKDDTQVVIVAEDKGKHGLKIVEIVRAHVPA